MQPARVVVTFEEQTFTYESPEDAQEFYNCWVNKEQEKKGKGKKKEKKVGP